MLAALLCNIIRPTQGWKKRKKKFRHRNVLVKWLTKQDIEREKLTIEGEEVVDSSALETSIVEVVRELGDYESLQPVLQKTIEPIFKWNKDKTQLTEIRKSELVVLDILTKRLAVERILKLVRDAEEEDYLIVLILSSET